MDINGKNISKHEHANSPPCQHPNADNFNQYLGAAQSESKAMERENLIFGEGRWPTPNWKFKKPSLPQNLSQSGLPGGKRTTEGME